MAGQELGDGPGGAGGGPLLPLTQLTAFVDGVHQQEESLLRRLHAQERQEDASEERRRENNVTGWRRLLVQNFNPAQETGLERDITGWNILLPCKGTVFWVEMEEREGTSTTATHLTII